MCIDHTNQFDINLKLYNINKHYLIELDKRRLSIILSHFQELLWVYKLVSPLKLGMAEATRVCNALALVQVTITEY